MPSSSPHWASLQGEWGDYRLTGLVYLALVNEAHISVHQGPGQRGYYPLLGHVCFRWIITGLAPVACPIHLGPELRVHSREIDLLCLERFALSH